MQAGRPLPPAPSAALWAAGPAGGSARKNTTPPPAPRTRHASPPRPRAPPPLTTGSPAAITTKGTTVTVDVLNQLTRDTGSLKITKTLDAGGSGFSGTFTIDYDCGNGLSGTVSVPAGGSATVDSIPTGSSC